MRRFWAFFTLLFTVVLSVALVGQPILERTTLSNEFTNGSVIQYSISLPEDSSAVSLESIDVAGEINDRLDTAGIRGADVEIIWPDDSSLELDDTAIVRITFPTQSSSELASFRRIVEGNGDLTISTSNTSADEIMTGDDFFADTVASVAYDDNNQPYVLLHVLDEDVWNTMYDRATAAEEGDEDGEDSATLYIWRDFDAGEDTYDKAFSDDENVYDATVEDKLLFVISTADFDEETLTISIDSDSSWDVDTARVPWAGNGSEISWDITSARAMVNSINAENYDFDIQYVYRARTTATLGSSALTRFCVGLAVVYLLMVIGLAVRYGIAGLLAGLCDGCAVMLTLYFGSLLGFELSAAAFVGLAVTAILGLICNTNYFSRVYSELRKGRPIGKANREGYHKSYTATVDIVVSAAIIGLFSFLIGRSMVKVAFGFIIIGAVMVFLCSNYLTKWFMYWYTACWPGASAKVAFGFRSRDMKTVSEPLYDASASAQQQFDLEDKAGKKARRAHTISWVSIGSTLAVCCTLVLGIILGVSGSDSLFAFSGSYDSYYVLSVSSVGTSYRSSDTGETIEIINGDYFTEYVQTEVLDNAYTELDAIAFDNFGVHIESVDEFMELTSITLDNLDFHMVSVTNDSGQEDNDEFTVMYATYTMPIISGNASEARDRAMEQVLIPGIEALSDTDSNPAATVNISISENFINDKLEEMYAPYATYGITESGYRDHADVFLIVGLVCMVLFWAVYVGIRYGLSAGLTQFFVSLFGTSLSLAVFALVRLPFTIYVGYGLLGGSFLSGVSLLPFYSRNKDLLKERKSYRTASKSERIYAAREAMALTWPSVAAAAVFSVAFAGLALGMYTTGSAGLMAVAFGVSSLASIICGAFLTPAMYPGLRTRLSYSTWRERYAAWRARRKKSNKQIIADPNEARETVVIGINEYRNW